MCQVFFSFVKISYPIISLVKTQRDRKIALNRQILNSTFMTPKKLLMIKNEEKKITITGSLTLTQKICTLGEQ